MGSFGWEDFWGMGYGKASNGILPKFSKKTPPALTLPEIFATQPPSELNEFAEISSAWKVRNVKEIYG